jgi:hypothetical protein
MQKSLPARPSLEQFRKQAKELVKNHRSRDAGALALIREFFPALAQKTDEEIILFPFALHDAQWVIARQYGFASWTELRDHLGALDGKFTPVAEPSVAAKFKAICEAYKRDDYALFASVMSERMRTGIPRDRFESVAAKLAGYFKSDYAAVYFGEMIQGEHSVYFWRVSAPGKSTDVMARMGVKDELVSGLLFSAPFGGAWGSEK